jgi:hypothetical protein
MSDQKHKDNLKKEVEDNTHYNKTKSQNWLQSFVQYLIGPLVVGIVVLLGQTFLQPIIAKKVKKEETILEQRYTACNDAFDTLIRKIEHASITKGEVKYNPVPTSKELTATEINSIYCRLALFSSSSSVPQSFGELIGAKIITIKDIGKFVLLLRNEMEISGESVEPTNFKFAYPTKEPVLTE